MFNDLSRDYWPAETKAPLLRTGLAFLVAPAITVAILLLLMVGAEVAFSSDTDMARSRALGVAPYLMVGTCIIVWTGGLAAFLILWSLRKRGRRHYLLAGLVVGLLAALALPLLSAQSVGVAPVIVMTVHVGAVFLILRRLAGVRRLNG
jgi:hypothetical protein